MDNRVRTVMAFMSNNLHRRLTSSQLAQTVRLSSTRLRHLFKDETGKSLTRYRRELQLQRAKYLLETTFLSVKEIAGMVGITTVSHFVRDFEKAYGATPARYAKRERGQ
jgi:two-component system response regulator YesN